MASPIAVTLVDPTTDADTAFNAVETIFRDHEQRLSRFNPDSELSQLNQNINTPFTGSTTLRDAISAAYRAYRSTKGLFDPRILTALAGHGYRTTFRDVEHGTSGDSTFDARTAHAPWRPEIQDTTINIGDLPIDLGGIGKGFTVDQAFATLTHSAAGILINAGGDLRLQGPGPDGPLWNVGIENPADPSGDPIAVLSVTDTAIATSSLSVRTWKHNGKPAHHLIDPRTGRPSESNLLSITVLASTASEAETLTKQLFLLDENDRYSFVQAHKIPALWMTDTHTVGHSDAMAQHIIWQATLAY